MAAHRRNYTILDNARPINTSLESNETFSPGLTISRDWPAIAGLDIYDVAHLGGVVALVFSAEGLSVDLYSGIRARLR